MNRTAKIALILAAALAVIFFGDAIMVASTGKKIFLREGCMNCHSFKGGGGEMAPDLTAVKDRHSTFWIMAQIKNPKSHNPDSRMPEFRHLSVIERYALARYLRD